MKKIIPYVLSMIAITSFGSLLSAQCLTLDVSLEKRIQQSNLIIDGQLIRKESFIKDKGIYTKNTIQVFRVFKGQVPSTGLIELITLGGAVGDEVLEVHPSLQLENKQSGMFFLHPWKKNANQYLASFDGMGFVQYDFNTNTAKDLYTPYGDIESIFLPMVMTKIGIETYREVSTPTHLQPTFGRRVAPVVSSFSPLSCPAGADSLLTINGTNFGATRGSSKVQFRDANSGGTTWFDAVEYQSWSDTRIEVFVPSRAGTGTFRISKGFNDTGSSPTTLNIPFSNLNATFGDEPSNPYYTQHTEDNGTNNDFNWQFNTRFFDSTEAKDAFIRSLEIWRCNTFIPWNVLSNTTSISDYEASDNINLVTWDHSNALPSNVLGRCYSRWSGCGPTGNRTAYVRELDIVFSITRNWHYALANASGGRYDFVSVCGHELGHAHQLGHVIDASKMMHFSIGPNQTKRALSNGDIAGGDLVNDRSVNSVCFRDRLILLNSSNCSLVNSTADFGADKTEACLTEEIVFTDSTKGAAITWTWNFGAGATPPTALGIGPHTVAYSTSGKKDVSLTITTLEGPKIETKTDYIEIGNDPPVDPKIVFSNFGNNRFRFYSEDGSNYTNQWYIPGQTDTATADTVYISFSAPGNYTVALKVSNECNDTTITVQLTDWTSTNHFDDLSITLYPNPAKDAVNIQGDYSQFAMYGIYDLSGKTIAVKPLDASGKIDVSQLQSGVYLLELFNKKSKISTKLIIK